MIWGLLCRSEKISLGQRGRIVHGSFQSSIRANMMKIRETELGGLTHVPLVCYILGP